MKVYLVKNISENKYYALKIMEKRFLKSQKKIKSVMNEKYALQVLQNDNKYIVEFYGSFSVTSLKIELYIIIEIIIILGRPSLTFFY